jgi:hypothetical protein
MQYVLLIYGDEAQAKKVSPEARAKMMGEYKTFTDELQGAGKMRGGAPLESVTTATTVRVKDGKTLRTDGPFAETREQLGGFYLVEAKDLDEAVTIAAKIPGAKLGSIEVRPVMPLTNM